MRNEFIKSHNLVLIFLIFYYTFSYSQTIYGLEYNLGPEIQVCEPENGGDLQCEPSVTINKNIVLVSWNDSFWGKVGSKTGSAVGWAISYNNGKNFNFGGYLPQIDKKFIMRVDGADSWLGSDSSGNFYLQVLSWQDSSHYLFVYFMDSKELGKWKKRYLAYSGKFIDKPSMSITPTGQINISFTSFIDKKDEIFFVHSSNQGKSWLSPIKLSNSINPIKTGSCVVSYNEKILVAWLEGRAMDQNEVWYAYSINNGFSFSRAKLLYRIKKTLKTVKGYTIGALNEKGNDASFLITASVWLTYTINDDETLFWLTFVEGTENRGSRVVLLKLDDNFELKSKPIYVGDISKDYERVFPTMTSLKKYPVIFYYDRRNNPFTTLTDVYLSV